MTTAIEQTDQTEPGTEPAPTLVIEGTGEFVCPECLEAGVERHFEQARFLGSHRATRHGVQGESHGAVSRRQETTSDDGQKPKRKYTRRNPSEHFEADKMLKLLYPEGMPTRLDLMERTIAWSNEARELWRLGRDASRKR